MSSRWILGVKMKLLDLFSTGTNGTSGTDLQGEGNTPSRPGPGKTGQRDQHDNAEGIFLDSGPVGPGPDLMNGTDKSVDALSSSRRSRSSRSEKEENISEQPDPAALAHAKRMLVSCPVQGQSLHCWYCSRCSEAGKCPAWRGRRADVEFFRKSEKPYSLYLVEEMESGEVLQ